MSDRMSATALLISLWAIAAASDGSAGSSAPQTVPAAAQQTLIAVIPDEYTEPPDGWSPQSSADQTVVAYHARKGEQSFVVVNGKPGPPYGDIRTIAVTRDGQVAYEARRNGAWVVVAHGKEGPAFDGIEDLTVAGNVVAYIGERAGRRRVVVGDQMGEEDPNIVDFTLSADGRSHAYVVTREQTMVTLSGLFLNGKYYWEDNMISNTSFTPDGKLVFASRTGTLLKGRSKVMLNDEIVSEHSEILTAVAVNADASRFAPVGCMGAAAQRRCVLKLDGTTVREAAAIEWPTFAPDGRTLAYAERPVGGKWHVVVGDRIGPDVEAVLDTIVFSPDGRRHAYPARHEAKEAMVVDGVVGAPFETVEAPRFNEDSRHFTYVATRGEDQLVVLDQDAGRAFRWVSAAAFDSSGKTLSFIALDGRRLVRVVTPVSVAAATIVRD